MQRLVRPPRQRLLVFARLPESGAVKTRLAASIGDERALAVYRAMLRDLIASIGESDETTEIEFLWPPTPHANGAALRDAFAHHSVAMQTGESLGDRLAMAFSERFFFHRTQKILAIGVDDPNLPRELIDHAFALLDSCEWVVGPATDGGYYLIGCRSLAFNIDVFTNIDWGTPTVLPTTLARIHAAQQTVALLPERSDIDTVEDLLRYPSRGNLAAALEAQRLKGSEAH
jgi:rSAM/selenodomain-associated transferase 1